MTRDDVKGLFERVLRWPPEQQELLSQMVTLIEAQERSGERENSETRAAIAQGLAEAERGAFATDDEVDRAFARFSR
jgi:predicted transcriptional regulator